MSGRSIVGVVLVRNEDIYLGAALEAAGEFCDEFLLFDHGSRDGSGGILRDFAARHGRAVVREIEHPRESHEALLGYCGRDVWVFGVDGDEVYDRQRLAVLRRRLLAGEFDDYWMVMGHCLHVVEVAGGEAVGYAAPPSRSVTKLYNFAAIEGWPGRSVERLHGGRPVFRRGFDAGKKLQYFQEVGWEESDMRCLHLCFCRRSSLDKEAGAGRANIDEIYNGWLPAWAAKMLHGWVGRGSKWKRERYMRGELVRCPTGPFLGK